ncbi:unnamed protein product [Alternaria alternata]|jgi:hypothetical protein|uniref:SAP domain-containing protein n=2 Tax=Alternaria sect. Alternaria TaxID=2499237 RepID=A0A4V1WQX3_ALTAL|nr:hypothetical protein AA0117_g9151 [Alternaria alternata]
MRTRKRALEEVSPNESPEPKLAKRLTRDRENASVRLESVVLQHADPFSLKEVLTLQLKYVTYAKPSYSFDLEDIKTGKHIQTAARYKERYDGKPAEKFPNWPYVISQATAELVKKYSLESIKRDEDSFDMVVSNDFTGYGLQEVIENQLTAINSLMAKRHVSADELAVGLWVRLSAFAHWTQSQQLAPWFMMDDGQRWQDTVAMIGIAILATLNALDRAKLLMEHSPVRDLGLVLALLGDFICDCLDQATTIPYLSSNPREICWPYKIVSYAKANGIKIKGVRGIEERFVQKFDDVDEANYWKRKECVDRWGWGTKVGDILSQITLPNDLKWRILCQAYGEPRHIFHSGPPLGGNYFDITRWPAAERKKYHFENKDPLEPGNSLLLCLESSLGL